MSQNVTEGEAKWKAYPSVSQVWGAELGAHVFQLPARHPPSDPVARHCRPRVWFLWYLFIGSPLCSTLLSDPASRRCPCASL